MAVFDSDNGQRILLAVVHGNAETRRGEVACAAARTEAPPAVEVIDRDTMATIQRLVQAGILSMNTPQQVLHGALAASTRDNGNERQRRIEAARRRLANAERKLRMARVLAEGGFEGEAAGPLAEALEEALGALADSGNEQFPNPIPLAQVRSALAARAGLGDDTLALLAILRESTAWAPPGAIETVAEAIERIGTTLDRQSLE
ncbi:MAG: hypothetical protein L0H63_10980, partial [Nitrococcus sp.]|nr:hypothetical protein [Nitrococcus sp.]